MCISRERGYIQLSQCCFVLVKAHTSLVFYKTLISHVTRSLLLETKKKCKCHIRKLYNVFMSYNPNPFWDHYYCRFFLSLCRKLHPSNCSIIGVNNMKKLKCKLPSVHTMYHHVIIFMSVIVAL